VLGVSPLFPNTFAHFSFSPQLHFFFPPSPSALRVHLRIFTQGVRSTPFQSIPPPHGFFSLHPLHPPPAASSSAGPPAIFSYKKKARTLVIVFPVFKRLTFPSPAPTPPLQFSIGDTPRNVLACVGFSWTHSLRLRRLPGFAAATYVFSSPPLNFSDPASSLPLLSSSLSERSCTL